MCQRYQLRSRTDFNPARRRRVRSDNFISTALNRFRRGIDFDPRRQAETPLGPAPPSPISGPRCRAPSRLVPTPPRSRPTGPHHAHTHTQPHPTRPPPRLQYIVTVTPICPKACQWLAPDISLASFKANTGFAQIVPPVLRL